MEAKVAQVDSLRMLIEVSRSLTAGLDVNEIVRGILGAAIHVIPGADSGILLLYKEEAKRLVVSHAVGMLPSAYDITIEPGEGLSGKAFLTGVPCIYPDREAVREGMSTLRPENLDRFQQATGGKPFPQSAMSAGLISKGEPIGAFVVENFERPNAFSTFDLDLIDALAQAAAIAIVNARLFEAQRENRIKLEALNEQISVQRDELQRRIQLQDSLAEIVKEGHSFGLLASRLRGLTQSSVAILDALNRVRCCEPGTDAETAAELDWLPEEDLLAALDQAVSTRMRQRVLDPRDGCEVMLSPIVGGGEVLGFIGFRSTAGEIDAIDEAAADSAALVAAAEFLKERAIEESEIRRREEILDDLLEGRASSSVASISSLRPPLGFAVGAMMVGEAPGPSPEVKVFRTFVAVTQEVLERAGTPVAVTVRGDHVVAMWPLAARGISEVEKDLLSATVKLRRVLPQWRSTFGLGSKVERLEDLSDVYDEVRLGLEVRRQFGMDEGVFSVDSLGAYRFILKAASGAIVAEFWQATLGSVLAHDAKKGGELIGTFRTYLNAGGSVKASADLLNVHPHTVQYRLDRLQKLSGLRLNNPQDRLTLEMAVRVMDAFHLVEGHKI